MRGTLCWRNLTTHQQPVFEQGNHIVIVISSFSKSYFFKMLSVRFEEPFRKAPFSRRISVNGRPNHKNKAAFSAVSPAWCGSCLRKHLLGLKSVVCPSVVQVVTQTADNQTKTFQITHKLIHTSSLLKPNNMLFAYIMFSILLYM